MIKTAFLHEYWDFLITEKFCVEYFLVVLLNVEDVA